MHGPHITACEAVFNGCCPSPVIDYIGRHGVVFVGRTNQNATVREAINSCLSEGVANKQDIYTKVADELGVPRPTVRRVAGDLRNEIATKIQILQSPKQESETD